MAALGVIPALAATAASASGFTFAGTADQADYDKGNGRKDHCPCYNIFDICADKFHYSPLFIKLYSIRFEFVRE
jgi:hypothetical protein